MISTVLRSEMNISRRRRLNQNVNPRCRVNRERERERERDWGAGEKTEKRNEKKTRPGCVVDLARRRWRSTTNTRATGQRALGNAQSTFTRTNEMRFRGLSKLVDGSKWEIYAKTARERWKWLRNRLERFPCTCEFRFLFFFFFISYRISARKFLLTTERIFPHLCILDLLAHKSR